MKTEQSRVKIDHLKVFPGTWRPSALLAISALFYFSENSTYRRNMQPCFTSFHSIKLLLMIEKHKAVTEVDLGVRIQGFDLGQFVRSTTQCQLTRASPTVADLI